MIEDDGRSRHRKRNVGILSTGPGIVYSTYPALDSIESELYKHEIVTITSQTGKCEEMRAPGTLRSSRSPRLYYTAEAAGQACDDCRNTLKYCYAEISACAIEDTEAEDSPTNTHSTQPTMAAPIPHIASAMHVKIPGRITAPVNNDLIPASGTSISMAGMTSAYLLYKK